MCCCWKILDYYLVKRIGLDENREMIIIKKVFDIVGSEFARIKLNTESGLACGGYFLVVEICRINTFPDDEIDPDLSCCKEEITYKNISNGFSGGDTIEAKLFDCSKFLSDNKKENLNIKLTSFEQRIVSYLLHTITTLLIPTYTKKRKSKFFLCAITKCIIDFRFCTTSKAL